ncbi:HesB/YadR/YfhF family protein [Caldalkalibacillus mannanilyticus]|uniref:HesB/YadR/YfhF family protein n=1 Tax=Caldalkalibacillus mannanilyticus TaxID=1418 RepID=UPI000469268A|nr:HesB/YadR/YfhF family protein [Caldalkalibacillus mannanilyticus]
MKLTVTPAAIECFKEQWGFKEGQHIRFFARYGGCGSVQASFSMGIAQEEPKEIALSTVEQGMIFYVEQEDMWYLNGQNLHVDYQPETEEIHFQVL